ncbi:kinesin-like protein KIN-1 isoform X3 [Physcomitrium patens]|nr:kinesin-like protein KIN-1 isoform X3 [Physcomitrium patens]|eukprot:XP_024394058.1 kinesin-like protein KIN-1 isoform X3 [Physcomitrella patens]
MNAINGTVLTYGQTGAGKTHSMEGPSIQTNDPKLKGILPRVTQIIFDLIERADEAAEFLIKLSMVEIYMEKIRDLLDTKKDNLQVKENKLHGIFVAGVTEKYVQSEKEMLQILQTGLANRAVGQTLMNCESSRSHCVFLLTIQQSDIEDRSIKTGKIYLVDLAGSEKVEKTGAEGKLLCEAKTINKSLSALGNVINALTSDKPCHVPYRDSKLTRILQDSLGGNSRTALLCCCSPSTLHASETLSTLRFGTRAKLIKNKPRVNSERGRHELESLLQKSYQECDQLRAQLLMSSARLRSLNQGMPFDAEANLKDSIDPVKLSDKLINKFPTRLPQTTGDVFELHKEIFVESLLEESFDKTQFSDLTDYKCDEEHYAQEQLRQHLDEEKLFLSAQDDTAKTIRVLQESLEKLMDEKSKLEKLNKGLEMELLACMRLLHDPTKAAVGMKWPTITSSVHGRIHANPRSAVQCQFKLLNMIDTASICCLWRSSLTKVRNIIGQTRRA